MASTQFDQIDESMSLMTKSKIFKIKKESSSYFFLKVFNGNTNIVLSKKTIKEEVE